MKPIDRGGVLELEASRESIHIISNSLPSGSAPYESLRGAVAGRAGVPIDADQCLASFGDPSMVSSCQASRRADVTTDIRCGCWADAEQAEIVVVAESGRQSEHARLNMIAHQLSSIPYEDVPREPVELPDRLVHSSTYERPPREFSTYVPDYVAGLLGDPERSD